MKTKDMPEKLNHITRISLWCNIYLLRLSHYPFIKRNELLETPQNTRGKGNRWPKPGATVSIPLHWEEVKKGLKMQNFTIQNSISRIKSEGDIFKPVLGKGIDLDKILANIWLSSNSNT